MSKFQPHWKWLWSICSYREKKEKWKKANTGHPHQTPALLMDKLTESLASLSPGPCHNCRLGRRVVFHVIRECLCFCPLGTKRRKRFSRTGCQTSFTREFYSITCKIISKMVISSLKYSWSELILRGGTLKITWLVGLTSSSPKMVPTSPPSHRIPHHQLRHSLFFACPDTNEDTPWDFLVAPFPLTSDKSFN